MVSDSMPRTNRSFDPDEHGLDKRGRRLYTTGMSNEPLWRAALESSALPEDEPVGIELPDGDGRPVRVVLVRRGERVFAAHDRCPHRGAPFSEMGLVDDDGTLLCGWHYWGFRLEDGVHTQVESIKLCTFPARVVDGRVEVDLSRPPPYPPPALVSLD